MSDGWKDYPANTPEKTGYYQTVYFHPVHKQTYSKCFWWDGTEWGGWRIPIDEHVTEFNESTHDSYYVPCMMKGGI